MLELWGSRDTGGLELRTLDRSMHAVVCGEGGIYLTCKALVGADSFAQVRQHLEPLTSGSFTPTTQFIAPGLLSPGATPTTHIHGVSASRVCC